MLARTSRAALFIVASALITGVLLLAYLGSGERSLAALERLVALATPYRLELADAELRWWPFHFRARGLSVDYGDPGKPSLLAVSDVDLAMPLASWWREGTDAGELRVSSVTYYIDDEAGDVPIDLEALLAPLAWLPARIHVDAMHIVARGRNVHILPLYGIEARRSKSGAISLSTEARYAKRRLGLKADLAWLATPGGGHRLDVRARFADRAEVAAGSDAAIVLQGSADTDGEQLSYDFRIDGTYPRAGDIATLLEALDVEVPGDLQLAGRLSGDRDRYVLHIDELALSESNAQGFVARGTIEQDPTGVARLDLRAGGTITAFDSLLPVPDSALDLVDSAEMQLRLRGTLDDPRLVEVALALATAGDGRARLAAPDLDVPINALVAGSGSALAEAGAVQLELSVGDLPSLLARIGVATSAPYPHTLALTGALQVDDTRAYLDAAVLRAGARAYFAEGTVSALWQASTLALPSFDVAVTGNTQPAAMVLRGSVADLRNLDGVVVDVSLDHIDSAFLRKTKLITSELAAGYAGAGRLRALRTGDMLILRDMDIELRDAATDTRVVASGQARLYEGPADADLALGLVTAKPGSAYTRLGLPFGPGAIDAQLRLRPTFATLLAQLRFGASDVQAVVNADLAGAEPTALGIDFYSPDVTLEDILSAPTAAPATPVTTQQAGAAQRVDAPSAGPAGADLLPPYPVHLTLRTPRLHSDHAELRELSVEVSTDGPRVLLQHFDARYSGGELNLRGAADLRQEPMFVSLAGRGIRVPVGTLTQDLGLQQSTTGDLSFRGGLTARGATPQDWRTSLQGQLGGA
jgi:hypothetical protein